MSLRYSIYKVQTSLSALASAFAFYHTQFHLSRTFFKFFQIFLRDFSARCSREQLRYVSTSALICQALFSRFCKFRTDSLFICAARKRLAYTSTHPPFCQALFFQFFPFILHLLSSHILIVCAGFLSLRESESSKELPNFLRLVNVSAIESRR